jgi:FlaA1/EpsC-like NDP-sugar epimerase
MGKKSFLGLIYDQLCRVPDVAHTDLKNKTVIVVGANTGLGFQAAEHFARMNAGRLILACRSEPKGQAAVDREFTIFGSSGCQ